MKLPENDCPRAKSFMTPCFLRDGDLALDDNNEYCIGCEKSKNKLLEERESYLKQKKVR